ncbi:MAG: hypothetical protein OHK0046_51750 [Anaerolineae bacterium]
MPNTDTHFVGAQHAAPTTHKPPMPNTEAQGISVGAIRRVAHLLPGLPLADKAGLVPTHLPVWWGVGTA